MRTRTWALVRAAVLAVTFAACGLLATAASSFAATNGERIQLDLDRSDVATSTATWDEAAGSFQAIRPHTPATFTRFEPIVDPVPANGDRCGYDFETADFNADGRADFVTSCPSDDLGATDAGKALVFLRNATNTGYETAVPLAQPTPGADACGSSLAVGDVNGDGAVDIAVGCYMDDTGAVNGGSAVVYTRNATNTGFDPGQEYLAPSPVATDICGYTVQLGDFDGNGRDDLAIGCPYDDTGVAGSGVVVVRLRNAANTGFDPGTEWAGSPTPVTNDWCGWAFGVGDVDGDLRDDLVIGCTADDTGAVDTGAVYVRRRNTANTGFDAGVLVQHPSRAASDRCAYQVEVRDLNGDARGDIVMGCPQDDNGTTDEGSIVVALRNVANTGFDAGTVFDDPQSTSAGCGSGNLAFGDVDGDGRTDISYGCPTGDIGATDAGHGVVLLQDPAGGTFGSRVTVSHPTPAATDYCGRTTGLVDLDGDGRAEMALGCESREIPSTDGGQLLITGATSAPTTLANPTPVANDQCGFALDTGDVNGDGLADLVTGCSAFATGSGAQRAVVYVRRGDNLGYLPGVELAHPSPAVDDMCGTSVAIGDVNGDGLDDVATGCSWDDTGAANTGSVVVWLRNPANTAFLTGVEYGHPSPASGARCGQSVVLGDVDADGRADLVMGCEGDSLGAGSVVVRLRDAANTGFAAGTVLANPTPVGGDYCGRSVDVGDVDGDGRGDVVAGCNGKDDAASDAGAALVFVRDPANTGFLPAATLLHPAPLTGDACGISVGIGDVDGDGHGDVAFGCSSDDTGASGAGSVVVRMRNVSNTGFDTGSELGHPTPGGADACGSSLDLADVNGDARADVAFACANDDVVVSDSGSAVIRTRAANNAGFDAGVIVAHPAPTALDQCGTVALGDMDGDGRAEPVVGCRAGDTGASSAGEVFVQGSTSAGATPVTSSIVETRRLNHETGTISAASVTLKRLANGAAAPTLEISADGGGHWQAATAGVNTALPFTGSDLRIRVTLPAAASRQATQLVHDLRISYTYQPLPASGALTQRVSMTTSRADVAASTATWDDGQGVIRQTRTWASARVGEADAALLRGTPGASDQCGFAVDTGDFNGDGLADVVVGCATVSDSSDNAYVRLRNATNDGWLTPVELPHPAPSNDSCGFDVATGDVNGDGRDDILMGCPADDAPGYDTGSAVIFTRNAGNTAFDTGIVVTHAVPTVSDQCGLSVAMGDVDGNGNADLVLGCVLDDTGGTDAGSAVVLRRNVTNTGFDTGVELSNPAATTSDRCGRSVATGDVNGDLRDDVVMGCRTADLGGTDAGKVVVFTRNAGNTAFDAGATIQHPTPAAGDECGLSVDAGDVSGDGRDDLLFGCSLDDVGAASSGTLVVAARNGTNNGFDAGTPLNAGTAVASDLCGVSVLAADINGDGLQDVGMGCPQRDAVGANSGTVVGFLRRTDNSGFEAGFEVTYGASTASDLCGYSIGAGDVNGDGREDMVQGCYAGGASSAGVVAVRSGSGAPYQLGHPTNLASAGCGQKVAGGDFDGDGLRDLVMLCDITGGPDAHLVVQLREARNVYWNAPLQLTHPTDPTGSRCSSIAVGDINGDGRDDIVAGCPGDDVGATDSGSAVVWLRNAANTNFEAGSVVPATDGVASEACGQSVATGDIDADGRDDVALGCNGSASADGFAVVLLRNAANTGFENGRKVVPTGGAPSDYCNQVQLGNIDGDEHADLVIGCYNANPLGMSNAGRADVYRWDRVAASYVAESTLSNPSSEPDINCGSIAIGDVDDDGLGDVLLGCAYDEVGGVTGAGSAVLFQRLPTNLGFDGGTVLGAAVAGPNDSCGYSVAFGDVNGDGRDDIGMTCATGPVLNSGRLLIRTRNAANTGYDAPLVVDTLGPTVQDRCTAVSFTDYDADGRADILLGCSGDDLGATDTGSVAVMSSVAAGDAGISTRQLTTKQLNRRTPGTVTAITPGGARFANGAAMPTVEVSADGGGTWEGATWGAPHTFSSPGSDLRMRISLPAAPQRRMVQLVNRLTIDYDYDDNLAPLAPPLVSPAPAATTTDTTPTLTATFDDPNGADTGLLQFQVCSATFAPAQTCAAAGGTLAASGSSAAGIADGANGSWTPAALGADTTWHWRARGQDSDGVWGPWSASRSLQLDATILVGGTTSLPTGSLSLGNDGVVTTALTVDSNDPQGYQLQAADPDNSWGVRCTPYPACGSGTVPDWSGSVATPSPWGIGVAGTGGHAGLTVLDTTGALNARMTKWGTPTTTGFAPSNFADNLFAGLTTTASTIHETTTVAPADTVSIAYRITPGGSVTPTPAGSYATTIAVTAVGRL